MAHFVIDYAMFVIRAEFFMVKMSFIERISEFRAKVYFLLSLNAVGDIPVISLNTFDK
jgi:hypothetical protein